MKLLRRQLPVSSPLTWRAVIAALGRHDPRSALSASLGEQYGMALVLLTDSGTAALALALRFAATARPAGYCLLPAFGCYDLASAALAADVPVVLYDIDPTSLAPRLETLAPFLTSECAALVVVDHFGLPTSLDEVRRLATAAEIPVIEDAAQAAGARWDGLRAGYGTGATVLSFGRGKGVTGGGGGALLISHALSTNGSWSSPPDLPPIHVSRIVFTAKLLAQFALGRPGVYGFPARLPLLRLGDTVFRPPREPAGMSRESGRVLSETILLVDPEAVRRRVHAARLRAAQLDVAPQSVVHSDARALPGWLRLPVLARHPGQLRRGEMARLGIASAYPLPLSDLRPLSPLLAVRGDHEGARQLCRQLLTLPTHGLLTETDLCDLEDWIRRNLR